MHAAIAAQVGAGNGVDGGIAIDGGQMGIGIHAVEDPGGAHAGAGAVSRKRPCGLVAARVRRSEPVWSSLASRKPCASVARRMSAGVREGAGWHDRSWVFSLLCYMGLDGSCIAPGKSTGLPTRPHPPGHQCILSHGDAAVISP